MNFYQKFLLMNTALFFQFGIINSVLWVVCGAMGIIGSMWIIIQYHRVYFLKTIPGFLIMTIAYFDFIHASLYIIRGTIDIIHLTNDIAIEPVYDDILFALSDWINLSASFVCFELAAITVYIAVLNGNTETLKTNKWFCHDSYLVSTCLLFWCLLHPQS
jgi:hypothetical protein